MPKNSAHCRVGSLTTRGPGLMAKTCFGGSPNIPWRLGGSIPSPRLRVNSATTRGPGLAAESGESSPGFTLVEILYNDGSVHREGTAGLRCNYFDGGSRFFWE